MSCNDEALYLRAGDAWSPTFVLRLLGVPEPLPDGAELVIRDSRGTALLTATIGDGLSFEQTVVPDADPVTNVIRLTASGADTLPLAAGNQRTELRLALAVFTIGAEDATRETIAVADVVVQPRMVGG